MRFACSAALFTLCILNAAARADDKATAREHFQRGTKLYDLQKYAEAAAEYEAAYEAKDDPALLFNIGQAYRFAGDYTKAIGAYRAFLRNLPRAPNRVEVAARIDEMQRLIEEQRRTLERPPGGTLPPGGPGREETPPPPPQPPPPSPPDHRDELSAARRMKIAGFATAGVGVALLVVGAVLEGLASSNADAFNHSAQDTVFDPGKESQVHTYEGAGVGLLVAGAAVAAAGVVVGVIGLRREQALARVTLVPAFDRERVAAVLNIRF